MNRLRLRHRRPLHLPVTGWGAAALAALAITLWVTGAGTVGDEPGTRAPRPGEGRRFHRRLGFWLDQAKADSRTLVAMVRYVLEPDPAPLTTNKLNALATNVAAPALARPSNSTAAGPKA